MSNNPHAITTEGRIVAFAKPTADRSDPCRGCIFDVKQRCHRTKYLPREEKDFGACAHNLDFVWEYVDD